MLSQTTVYDLSVWFCFMLIIALHNRFMKVLDLHNSAPILSSLFPCFMLVAIGSSISFDGKPPRAFMKMPQNCTRF